MSGDAVEAGNRIDHFGNHGHCWHPLTGQMASTEICCHCGAKREPQFVFEHPPHCGPFAPKRQRLAGYRGAADAYESVPDAPGMMRSIGVNRWQEVCPGDPPAGEGEG